MSEHQQPGPGFAARLDAVLGELLRQAPEVEAAAVVSFDGLPMASALPLGMDEDRVAAMSAALLSLGERAAQGLGRGDLSQVYVEGQHGTVFLVSADDEAVLVAVGAGGAKVGLLLFEVRRAAQAVAAVLRSVPEPAAVPVPEYRPEPAYVPEPEPQRAYVREPEPAYVRDSHPAPEPAHDRGAAEPPAAPEPESRPAVPRPLTPAVLSSGSNGSRPEADRSSGWSSGPGPQPGRWP